ncbi:hypothetical protein Hanom_Chr02g00121091 [Helianthus anomalus]
MIKGFEWGESHQRLITFSYSVFILIKKRSEKRKCLSFNGEKWMELTSRTKMTRFQTCWIQMRKNKPLDESRKSGQTSETKMAFYSLIYEQSIPKTVLRQQIYEV